MAFFDLALVYDPVTRRTDLAIGADGDLVIDETPVTPMLLSLGADRRALSDDELPAGRDAALNARSTGSAEIDNLMARRGATQDGVDANGERTGSRLWLLDRAKENDLTLALVRAWAGEALDWVEDETGIPAEVDAAWLRRGVLALRCKVADGDVSLALPTGAA
jgi:phage gp46-like protein